MAWMYNTEHGLAVRLGRAGVVRAKLYLGQSVGLCCGKNGLLLCMCVFVGGGGYMCLWECKCVCVCMPAW